MNWCFSTPNGREVEFADYITFMLLLILRTNVMTMRKVTIQKPSRMMLLVGNHLIDMSALSSSIDEDGPLMCKACASDACDSMLDAFISYACTHNQSSA